MNSKILVPKTEASEMGIQKKNKTILTMQETVFWDPAPCIFG
jgi:hypothetical protein